MRQHQRQESLLALSSSSNSGCAGPPTAANPHPGLQLAAGARVRLHICERTPACPSSDRACRFRHAAEPPAPHRATAAVLSLLTWLQLLHIAALSLPRCVLLPYLCIPAVPLSLLASSPSSAAAATSRCAALPNGRRRPRLAWRTRAAALEAVAVLAPQAAVVAMALAAAASPAWPARCCELA